MERTLCVCMGVCPDTCVCVVVSTMRNSFTTLEDTHKKRLDLVTMDTEGSASGWEVNLCECPV